MGWHKIFREVGLRFEWGEKRWSTGLEWGSNIRNNVDPIAVESVDD